MTLSEHTMWMFSSCEAMVNANHIEDIRVKLKFDVSFVVKAYGHSGGLTLLWRSPYNCNIINYSQNFINVQIQRDGKLS